MTATAEDFLCLPEICGLDVKDRFIALIWWHATQGAQTVTLNALCEQLANSGYAGVNKSREKAKLIKDIRTISSNKGESFRISARALQDLDVQYAKLLATKPTPKSDTLLSLQDFVKTRGYIEKVVLQINVSYDMQLYDCCAVMIRRLLETLIIELYLKLGREKELHGDDGHYKMFAGLMAHVKRDVGSLGLGRNTPKHLEHLKDLADKSAHARNYNATQKLIDDKKHDFQMAVAELKQLIFDN